MTLLVENPVPLLVETSYALYNSVKNADLPAASGHYGIDNQVWTALIALTKAKMAPLGIPVPSQMNGLCIWASVVACKFFVLRNHIQKSHVYRVRNTAGGADHYFVIADDGGTKVAADITCGQFKAGPDYLVGRLSDISGAAKKIHAVNAKLSDAYAAGAAAKTYVV